MLVILRLSLKNLFRSKRRSLFLGLGLAIGFMILIVADSFSQGLSDILLNRVVINFTGHIEIMGFEKAGRNKFIIRDKPRLVKIVKEVLDSPDLKEKILKDLGGVKSIRGNAMLFITGIGTKSSQVMLLGREPEDEFLNSLSVVEGNPEEFKNLAIPDAVIISRSKAEQLGVKVGDRFRSMFQTIYGQFQTADFTVVALTEGSDIFAKGVGYARLEDLKHLLGYREWETGSLQVNFRRVKNKKLLHKLADEIYKKMKPAYAIINAVTEKEKSTVNILPFKRDPTSMEKLSKILSIDKNELERMKKEPMLLLSDDLSQLLRLKKGDKLALTYTPKFSHYPVKITLTIAGSFPSRIMGKNYALMHEDQFYSIYFDNLPKNYSTNSSKIENSPLRDLIGKEWILLPRGKEETDLKEEFMKINRINTSGLIISIRTMYETAGPVIKLESALKSVTFIGVLILFFIVLIGVVNSLRMSVRERTREIGTIRAIGATRSFVLFLFLGEIFWLTLLSAGGGLLLAFGVMKIIGEINFHISGPFSLLFPGGHIHFLPTFSNILYNFLFLLFISLLAAYFPARGAAKMSPSEALRHYE